MTRGRPLTTALDVALHIARHRGTAMRFLPAPDNFAHLLVRSPGRITFVFIRYTSRIHLTPAEVEEEYAEALARLRLAPGAGPVARELWLYSRYGCWRYFRVGDATVEEVSAAGEDVVPVKKAKAGKSPTKATSGDGEEPGEAGMGKITG